MTTRAAGPHDAMLDHESIVLQARDVHFDWSDLPVHYVPGEPFVTHFCNVLHLLLPAGEEFFVEVFKEALPLIQDDQLRLDVQGFIGQEAMHSQTHAAVVEHFRAQGIDMSPYTDQMRWVFERVLGNRPRWSKRRQRAWLLERIALISAIEHYTAILGEWILETPELDAIGTHPAMLDMLRWHGAEEVEHKAVAFDVMKHLKSGWPAAGTDAVVVTPLLVPAVGPGPEVHVLDRSGTGARYQGPMAGLVPAGPPGPGPRSYRTRQGGRLLLPAELSPSRTRWYRKGGQLPGRVTVRARRH